MNSFDKLLRTQRIIWTALMLAPVAYLVVAVVAVRPTEAPTPVLLPALAFVSLMMGVMSFVLPASIFARALRQRVGKEIVVSQVADQSAVVAEGGFREAAPSVSVVQNPDEALHTAAMLDMSPMILTLAFRESIALNGLVLGLLGFSLAVTGAFVGVSVALMALRRPSREALRARVEAVLAARMA